MSKASNAPSATGPLAAAMTALAGMPDYSSTLDAQMVTIARLTAERVEAASYASITALRGRSYITVAVSNELIQAVDDAQYADRTGPCLQALATGVPVGVTDIDLTVQWPGFHEAAPRMGLHASVSVPLHAGRGDAIAALNVYGHDRAAMAPLIAGICSVHGHFDPDAIDEKHLTRLDAGGEELVAGYAASLSVRAVVRLAIEMIRTDNRCTTDDAYLSLCIQAGEAGSDLGATASSLVNRGF